MGTKGLVAGRRIPHPAFESLEQFISYMDSHRLYSPHTVTVYAYLAELHFIARGEPYEHGDALKYYNPCCCVELRRIEGLEGLIERARERIAQNEIPYDWRDELVRVMQSQMTAKAPETMV